MCKLILNIASVTGIFDLFKIVVFKSTRGRQRVLECVDRADSFAHTLLQGWANSRATSNFCEVMGYYVHDK